MTIEEFELESKDIIKAIDCCCSIGGSCRQCPIYIVGGTNCNHGILAHFLRNFIECRDAEIDILIRKKDKLQDEIAEQQTEIERLKHILVSFMSEVENWEYKYNIDTSHIPKIAVLGAEKGNILAQIKADTQKDLAEKLKAKKQRAFIEEEGFLWCVSTDDIDEVLKGGAE